MNEIPEDPHGYLIRYADEGDGFEAVRLADGETVGVYPTRAEAVAAAEDDPASP